MTRTHPSHRSGYVAAAVATIVVLVIASASVAGAHGDDAVAELVAFTPAIDGRSAEVTVKLTYANDAEPVADATVTVAGDDGAGTELTPAALQPGPTSGLFVGTIALPGPGTWNFRVTSISPDSTLAFSQTVAAAPTTTTTGAPATTTSVASVSDAESASSSPAAAADDDDETPIVWIVVAALAVVGVAVGAVLIVRGRRSIITEGDA